MLLKLSGFFGMIAVAWWVSTRYEERSRRIAGLLPIVAVGALCCLVPTGVLRNDRLADMHSWVGHALGSFLWLSVPFAIGWLLERDIRRRPVRAIVRSLAPLSTLALGLLASATGYLGPTHSAAISEETRNRFQVLHLFVLPTLLTLLLVIWRRLFLPTKATAK